VAAVATRQLATQPPERMPRWPTQVRAMGKSKVQQQHTTNSCKTSTILLSCVNWQRPVQPWQLSQGTNQYKKQYLQCLTVSQPFLSCKYLPAQEQTAATTQGPYTTPTDPTVSSNTYSRTKFRVVHSAAASLECPTTCHSRATNPCQGFDT
jgi:hypothetical protein